MIFNILNYDEHHVMRCRTEDAARHFTSYLHNIGKRWYGGESYESVVNYKYGDKTCYRFIAGQYCDLDYYEGYDCEVLEYDDFDWPLESLGLEVSSDDVSYIDDFISSFVIK